MPVWKFAALTGHGDCGDGVDDVGEDDVVAGEVELDGLLHGEEAAGDDEHGVRHGQHGEQLVKEAARQMGGRLTLFEIRTTESVL